MARAATTRTPAQMFALVFGVVYLLLGIVGFAVTGFDEFAGSTFNEKLLVFPLNPLHNIVHLAVGALWIASSRRHDAAKNVNTIIGVVYLLTAVLGFAGLLEWLAIEGGADGADNWLHLASGALSLYFGTAGATVASRPAAAA